MILRNNLKPYSSPLRGFIKLLILLILISILKFSVLAQDTSNPIEKTKTVENADDEILKVSSELIQTGVSVFDKKGQFVDNLKLDDFELTVDGKPASISFFEQNTVKSVANDKITNTAKAAESKKPVIKALAGRNIVFLIDDLRLSFDSYHRIKKLIVKFVENEMSPEDMVAIVSASGKIGFLQQFTNDKTVLQYALERFAYSGNRSATDRLIMPMSEYEALLISRYDTQVTDLFIAQEIGDLESKREAVRSRARSILLQAASVNRTTYSTLEQTIRKSSQLPGRKIVFFLSDGFFLDHTNTDSIYRLQRITDAAARTNSVIYTFDAKGLDAGLPEGTSASSPNIAYRVQSGERFEKQDGLYLLADETGGKFIKDTNDLQPGLSKAIDEASQYYLLAWEPVSNDSKSEKLKKIEVRVKNRPELKVRVQSGYFSEASKTAVKKNKPKSSGEKDENFAIPISEQQLTAAVTAQFPARQIPTALSVNYVNISKESVLLAKMQIDGGAVEFTRQNDKAKAEIDIVGIVYNTDGKREGFFRQLLTLDNQSSKPSGNELPKIYYDYQTKLKPGLYQMRVAVRDVKSGRLGSAIQWIEIPDLSSKKLTLSSLLIGEQTSIGKKNSQNNDSTEVGAAEMKISVDRRFAASSRLQYLVYIYNAAQKSKTDLTVSTQVLRGKDVVLIGSPARISIEEQDEEQMPYGAEILLNTLQPGRYELLVTVQDRNSKTEAARRVFFEVK